MKLSQKTLQKAPRLIKIVMASIAIGWLSCLLLQEILAADAKAEASYPTMNQDFGKLISYMLGKLVTTIVYIIVVIPGMIYGALPLPESFWGVLVLEAIIFGVLLRIVRSDLVLKYYRVLVRFFKRPQITRSNKSDEAMSQFDSRYSGRDESNDNT